MPLSCKKTSYPKKTIAPELFDNQKVQGIIYSNDNCSPIFHMNIVQVRFGNTLSYLLYNARLRERQFQRLLIDRPTGVKITVRDKNPEVDLKSTYWATNQRASGIAIVFLLLVYLIYPEYHPTVIMGKRKPYIEVPNIPQTTQTKRPPPPPRPQVPLAVAGDEVPEDVTIESTELDFDQEFHIAAAEIGPISDEPLDYTEIDYKPHPIRIVTPEYPTEARKKRLEGRVMVRALVDKKGNVERVEVLHGPEIFRKAAEAAAQQFRFRPGKHEGERRKVWMLMPIEFSLK